jgi:hypothetical protein
VSLADGFTDGAGFAPTARSNTGFEIDDGASAPGTVGSGTRARLRVVEADDLAAIWRFCTRCHDAFRGCGYEDFRAIWHYRWRLNPASSPGPPLGWVLETSAAEVVGFSGLVPIPVKIGKQSKTALCGANWYIRPEYRRYSLAAFRQYAALGASHVMLSTGLSPAAAIVHARCGGGMRQIPVDGIDQSLWWIIDPKRFLAWKAAQLGAASRLWRMIGAAPFLGTLGTAWSTALGICTDPEHRILPWLARAGIAFACPPLPVERVTWFTDEFDQYWSEQRQRHDVTIERTATFLNWRHLLLPKAAGECFAFACRDQGRLLGYVTLQTPGYRGRQPGCFTVTDLVYPAEREDVLGNLMNTAFRFAVERGGTVLKLSGFHPAVRAALATQRPHVIAPDTLRTLAQGQLGQGLLAGLGVGRKARPSAEKLAGGSYWYKVPTAELAEICRSGSWWPSGVDGTSNL